MNPAVERRPLATRVALVRVIFGLLWAVDAWLKWQPGFIPGFREVIAEGAKHQPAFLKPWFDFWIHIASLNPPVLAYLTVLVETLMAISLLVGLARRPMYLVGLVFSLLIWATAEGFGGPYTARSTDLGTAITYAVVFALLFLIDDLAGRSPLAIDSLIEQRLPWWSRIARTPPRDRVIRQLIIEPAGDRPPEATSASFHLGRESGMERSDVRRACGSRSTGQPVAATPW